METAEYEKKLCTAGDLVLTNKRVVRVSGRTADDIPLGKVDSVSYTRRRLNWLVYAGAFLLAFGLLQLIIPLSLVLQGISPLLVLAGIGCIVLSFLFRREELVVRSTTLTIRGSRGDLAEFAAQLRKALYKA